MKNANINCGKRRTQPLFAIICVFVVLFFMREKLEVNTVHREKGGVIDMRKKLVRKHPPVIITSDKLQAKSLARAVRNSMNDRLKMMQQKCLEGWKPKNDTIFKRLNLFYYDARRKLGYCHAAKAGCTFWLRMFTYLTRRVELRYYGITSPFSIERIRLHTGSLSPRTANFWNEFLNHTYTSTFRFLFARNPYSRILSVYLDKYYLLGHSQTVFVPSLTCHNSDHVSFERFLSFAMTLDDHHLIPISDLCNPCEFQPDAIGKMETFKTDAQFILDEADYGSLLRHYNHSFRIGVEVQSIISENFEYLADIQSRYGDDCMSAKALSRRLWNVFQFNGYIPSNLTLPEEGISFTKYGILTYIKGVIQNHTMSMDQSKFQQAKYLSEFYSNVSERKIFDIQQRYSGDFALFGYNEEVPQKPSSQWQ